MTPLEELQRQGALGSAAARPARRAHVLAALGLILLAGAAAYLGWREHVSQAAADPGLARAFVYEMEHLKSVDPALLAYEEGPAFATGFAVVRRLALAPGGTLLVAGDRSIRVFTAQGERTQEFALAAEPHCVAAGASGDVYVGLLDHVQVFGARGERMAEWKSLGPRAHLTAIAAGSETVYLADSGQRVVHGCDRAGNVCVRIAEPDAARQNPGLIVPSPYLDVDLGPAGLLFVSNPGRHRLETYTPAGDLERTCGKAAMRIEGFCGCCNPVAFAALPGGGFVTSEKGLARVKVLDAAGVLACVVAGPASFAGEAFGVDVAVDGEGGVYVLDGGARSVRVFHKRKDAGHAKP